MLRHFTATAIVLRTFYGAYLCDMAKRALLRVITRCLLVLFVAALMPQALYHGCLHEHGPSAEPVHGQASIGASEYCALCDVITPLLFVPVAPSAFLFVHPQAFHRPLGDGLWSNEAGFDRVARGPPTFGRDLFG